MPWVKLSLNVPQNKLGLVEDTLMRYDVQSLTVSGAENETLLEHTLHEIPMWSCVRIEALFTLEDDIQRVLLNLRILGMEALDISFVGDQEWQQPSTRQVEPMDFGRLRVVPRNEPITDAPIVVRLDPGLAFGTGVHPTTNMCLAWLAEHPPRHLRVLDFGTGSGILGIAAKKLGARTVDAVDIDFLARQTAQENAEYNDTEISVTERIPAGERYELIVANILLNTILQFAPILTASLNSRGVILLTGLLSCQLDLVKSAYSEIEFENTVEVENWCLLTGTKI